MDFAQHAALHFPFGVARPIGRHPVHPDIDVDTDGAQPGPRGRNVHPFGRALLAGGAPCSPGTGVDVGLMAVQPALVVTCEAHIHSPAVAGGRGGYSHFRAGVAALCRALSGGVCRCPRRGPQPDDGERVSRNRGDDSQMA